MLTRIARKLRRIVAAAPVGATCECVLCSRKVREFLPYRGGWSEAPAVARVLRLVGSDPDHYLCPACGSTDRERHLLAYMRASGVLVAMPGKTLLQFAPEAGLRETLARAGLARHVRADLYPASNDVEKIDLLAVPYPDASFDFVMVNHVLEHVADDLQALREIRRLLKPGGRAILQTPFSGVLERTISDPGVTTAAARLELYGQEDHVRMYGRDIFARFASVGLVSRVQTHDALLPELSPARFGMNREEPFFLFEREA